MIIQIALTGYIDTAKKEIVTGIKTDYLPLLSSALIRSQRLRLLDILGQGN